MNRASSPSEIVRAREDLLRFDRHESAFAVDAAGRVVLDKRGEPSSVTVTGEECVRLREAGGVLFTHNHPGGWNYGADDLRRVGHSFSASDVRLACETNLAEMRAITPRHRYSLMPPPSRVWDATFWQTKVLPAFRRHNLAVSQENIQRIRARTATPEEVDARHYHDVWTRVAGELGLVYTQTEE